MTAERQTLADYVQIKGRFRRSVHLEKDFAAASQNGEYIITPAARGALQRLAEGMGTSSPYRAWTLTGPYGVGKSAFAVFLTRLLCAASPERNRARVQLQEADPRLAGDLAELGIFDHDSRGYVPVLATARRTSVSMCLAEGIVAAAASTGDRRIKASVRSLAEILENRPTELTDTRQIVSALSSLSETAGVSGYAGVLLVVDELGKLFEYAARYPEKGDVFLLQELAEHAARSGGKPILLVGLLHQSFQEYGQHLDLATRREWAKIQGRFEDIAFLEPADQVIGMIAQAVSWVPAAHENLLFSSLGNLAATAAGAGVAPLGMRGEDFEATAEAAYPLHPVTLVALPFVFRRFAQNERSLFSYLSGLEPYGFQEFLSTHQFRPESMPLVRLADLFDYFTRSFGAGLYRHPQALRWMEAADILERREALSPLQREVIKTVGVLNALGEFCHLSATEQVVSVAVTDSTTPSDELQGALESLREASIVTYRKFNKSYRIWEGSDVDVEERIAEGERQIRRGLRLADSVRRYLPPRPLVARRHSFETGALRWFAVEYVDDPERLSTYLEAGTQDGKVLVCLAESPSAADQFQELATQSRERQDVCFAIPQLIGELRAVVTELGALRWAWDNTPELRDDRVARREMSLRIAEADQLLRRSLDGLLDPRDEPFGSGCLWIHGGEVVPARSPVEVSQLLSDVCDRRYEKSVRIRNELITRRSISSAAAAARRNLIERMLAHEDEESLGIEGYPPERSMYESVLRATGLHRQDAEAKWGFREPIDGGPTRIEFAWDSLHDALFERQPEPVSVARLFADLEAPPLGVLAGLHPVLLCAFMRAHRDETTLYKEGAFLPEPGIADFEVLMRRPELFAVAGSHVSGGRAIVLGRLARGLNVKAATVPVVRALFRMVKGLPAFAWNTRRLPAPTLALREAFQNSQSPENLLFVQLPTALGLAAFSEVDASPPEVERFFDALNASLQALAEATPRMIDTARDILLQGCGLNAGESQWIDLRRIAVTLEPVVTEPQLSTFLRRVAQSGGDSCGIESVLGLLANRSPSNWTDADVDRFPEVATATGRAFRQMARTASARPDANAQLAALTENERRQAEGLLIDIRRYLEGETKESSIRVTRAAIARLLEELDHE